SLLKIKFDDSSFTADSVKDFLLATILKIKNFNRLFSGIISLLLFATYYSSLNYFMNTEDLANHMIMALIGLMLTLVSHLINTRYWNNAMKAHMEDLNSYLNELKSKEE